MEDLAVSQECIDILKDRSASSRIAEETLEDIGSLHNDLSALVREKSQANRATLNQGLSGANINQPSRVREPAVVEAGEQYTVAVTNAIQKAIDLVGNPFRYERRFEFEDFRDD